MPKRNHTRQRTDRAVALAATAGQLGWSKSQLKDGIDHMSALYFQHAQPVSITNFMIECTKFADPRLSGCLPALIALAKRSIDLQPPGGKLRYNHELAKFCGRALKHPAGPGAAVKEIEADLAAR